MIVSDRTTTRAIFGAFENTNTKAPAAVAAAYATTLAIEERAATIGTTESALIDAVTAALLREADPATDPGVQRAVAGMTLAGYVNLPAQVTNAGYDLLRDVCHQHIDAMVLVWRKAFDKAATALETAHDRIGDLDLEDTKSIMAKGSDIADIWAAAQTADRTIDAILGGWNGLLNFCRYQTNPRYRVLRIADVSLAQFRDLPEKVKPWEALRAGLTLSLPTASEYRARIVSLERATAEPEMVVNTQRSLVAGREIREAVLR